MSKQPTIKIPVAGGHWELGAHNPRRKGGLKYSAQLHLTASEKIVCFVFANDEVAIDDGCLILDSTHIFLGGHADIVDEFLERTGGYDGEEE